MNMHMPQDEESMAELRYLAAVPRHIISPAKNASIVGIFQDSLLSSYRFTRPNIKFSPRDAMNLMMYFKRVNPSKLVKDGKKLVSSFDIMSQILPPMSMKATNGVFDGDNEDFATSNNVVEILAGEMKRGQLDKGIFGSGSKGILASIFNDYGFQASSDFIDDLQNVVTEYMKMSGYSVGISDLIADAKTNEKISDAITEKKKDVKDIIDRIHLGVFDNNSGKSNREEFEVQVNTLLNQAREDAGKIGKKSLDPNNRFVQMVQAGSKGSSINIAQMISCLGQQNVEGKRIPYGFTDRTLPHFTKFDDSPEARGFVENSFIQGLTPQEMFFHAMGGRVGLIDTAVKTSSTGYIQRRLIKSLEDLKVEYDMTVRNNMRKIIQFSYGEDGVDSTKTENQTIPLAEMTLEEIYAHFQIPVDDTEDAVYTTSYTAETLQRMRQQKDEVSEKSKAMIDNMIGFRDLLVKNVYKHMSSNKIHVPVNFKRITNNIRHQCGIRENSMVDITPLECMNMVKDTWDNLYKIKAAPPTPLFEIMFFYYLSPQELLMTHHYNKKSLEILLATISTQYKKSIVAPGEMVGLIAAQSIGEPTTQLTLNSVTYETEISVKNGDGAIKRVQIGDFVKEHIEKTKKMEYYESKDTTYAELDIKDEFYEVQAPSEDGDMLWCRIEAVTKHPVVNEDGSDTMLKITTENMREVTVTKAKGVLRLEDGKLVEVNGDKLSTDDFLPVSVLPHTHTPNYEFNLKQFLPTQDYLYVSEFEKAVTHMLNGGYWWKKHSGVDFNVPYTRPDSFREFARAVEIDGVKVTDDYNHRGRGPFQLSSGCVYLKDNCTSQAANIPENIPLDYNFGYLIGAYCAEGCVTDFQVSIANNDNEYLVPVEEWCNKYNITTKYYSRYMENRDIKGTSSVLRLYSKTLTHILTKLCGKLSHNKQVPDVVIFSNTECRRGFLDAYFGGDGTVPRKGVLVSAVSVSLQLLRDISVLLNVEGIYSIIRTNKPLPDGYRGFTNTHQGYTLSVHNAQAKKLAGILRNIRIQEKRNLLIELCSRRSHNLTYNKFNDKFLPNYNTTTGEIVMQQREAGKYDDIVFERIASIEEVKNTTNYAYDLTVETTRNFITSYGVNLVDTFHSAGISSKTNVTLGVPRIEEVLSLSKEPKLPSVTVYLREQDQTNRQKAQQLMHVMEYTSLREIVNEVSVCFDPDDRNSLIKEDREMLDEYYMFQEVVDESLIVDKEDQEEETQKKGRRGRTKSKKSTQKSKWIIRFEFNREEMLDRNISMDDVHYAIEAGYKDEVECVFTDYNADNLVMRIRLREMLLQDKNKSLKDSNTASLDQSDQIYLLNNIQDNLLDNVVLKGVKNIKKVHMRKVQGYLTREVGQYKSNDIWVLDTVGSNLQDILGIDGIDVTRTYSNDVIEMYNVLGIEAARNAILTELKEVLEFDGTYINSHHMGLLCDRMCATSSMVSVFRHGINNDNIGPLAKASFEETPEMFLRAARHGELDHMRGLSANVMTGQRGNFGTSAFQVVLDMNKMKELSAKNVGDEGEDIDEIFDEGNESKADMCSSENIVIPSNTGACVSNGNGKKKNDNYDLDF